jgi:uncharacterized membrane protein YbjE (DUF340 family)
MTIIILGSVALGIITGNLFFGKELISNIESLTTIILTLLLFSVGIDIGSNKDNFKNIKKKGKMFGGLVLGVIAGTLVGGLITGILFNMQHNASLAISAGFGWYSLSSVILTKMGNAEIGAIAFLTNVFRELFAFILIPILAKYINYFTALAPPGATSMDTTLPIISQSTNSNYAMIGFLNGAFLTFLVPILVPFFYLL